MINSIKKKEKMVERNSKDKNYTDSQVYFNPIIQTKKGSSKLYRVLTQKSGIPKGAAKWEIVKDNPVWKQVFLKVKATTTDPRLIWLQYRHNIITTNKSVSKFKHDVLEKWISRNIRVNQPLWRMQYYNVLGRITTNYKHTVQCNRTISTE